jgi:hypothetical protein
MPKDDQASTRSILVVCGASSAPYPVPGERVFRLLCRCPNRLSSKKVGEDAGVAAQKATLRMQRDNWPGTDKVYFVGRTAVVPVALNGLR